MIQLKQKGNNMNKFKGFALVRLIRATTYTSPATNKVAYSYEYELHTKMGHKSVNFMTDNERRYEYSNKLLMRSDDNHAVLRDTGDWEIISATEYHTLAALWESI